MRFLFWFLMLAAAAVVVALAVKLNAGYALLVAPPYRIELSLNLLLVMLVAGFFGLYFVIRVVVAHDSRPRGGPRVAPPAEGRPRAREAGRRGRRADRGPLRQGAAGRARSAGHSRLVAG